MLAHRVGERPSAKEGTHSHGGDPADDPKTGKRTPVEQGVELAGLDFGSLTAKELRAVQAAADEAAGDGARRAAEHVIEERRKAEVARLRKRLDELSA